MYHRKYACKKYFFMNEKKRIFILPMAIAWMVLCAVLVFLILPGRNHTPFLGTGAYFNDTESAAVQLQIDFKRGYGLTEQQAAAGDGTLQTASSGSSTAADSAESGSAASSAAGNPAAESSGPSSQSLDMSSPEQGQVSLPAGKSAVESSSAENSQAESAKPADGPVQSVKENEEP